MSTIRDAAADYLALRRGLGYKLETQGQVLAGFVGYLEQTGAATVTIEAAVAWATQPADADPVWWSNKLSVARGFARYLQTIDSSTEVPPAQLLPKRSRRATPYLYAPAEVAALIAAAGALALPLKAATYQTLIGLLAVSGMRVGAAVRLDRDHVDFEQGLLRIIKSKFGKSRELPLHPSTVQALTAYARQRDRLCPQPTASSFFVSTAGNRLHPASVRSTFARLVEAVGLQPRSPRCRPRLHDLRHSFAVATLLDWYRAGVDVQGPAARALYLPRARRTHRHLLVPAGGARAAHARCPTPRADSGGAAAMSSLAPTLEAFFTDRLLAQRQASPNTVACYRDTFRLLLAFLQEQTGTPPSRLAFDDLDAATIAAFLDHLEHSRGSTARTRNTRLAAVRSFFRYAALRHPEHAGLIQRVLAIPSKRERTALVTFLDRSEIDALLKSPDRSTWTGRRDHALLLVALQTGLRVSELTRLSCGDLELGTGAHLRCHGKGRKERVTPLTSQTVAVLRAWLRERRGQPTDPLFPSRSGGPLSRDAIERRLAIHTAAAQQRCPSLRRKRVTAHTLRHSAAMTLLQAGIDTSVIALWLGHEDVRTTQIYLHADLALKERALARTTPPNTRPGRYRVPDSLLAFLDSL